MERRTRRNHFSSAALSITDDLLRRSEPPSSANSRPEQSQQSNPLFDHLVGGREERWRHGEAEHPGGLGLITSSTWSTPHRQVPRVVALEDASGIDA